VVWETGDVDVLQMPYPVHTKSALVVGQDWSSRRVRARDGHVPIVLQRGDPSGVVMVVEQR
jgi:hypothetical protein